MMKHFSRYFLALIAITMISGCSSYDYSASENDSPYAYNVNYEYWRMRKLYDWRPWRFYSGSYYGSYYGGYYGSYFDSPFYYPYYYRAPAVIIVNPPRPERDKHHHKNRPTDIDKRPHYKRPPANVDREQARPQSKPHNPRKQNVNPARKRPENSAPNSSATTPTLPEANTTSSAPINALTPNSRSQNGNSGIQNSQQSTGRRSENATSPKNRTHTDSGQRTTSSPPPQRDSSRDSFKNRDSSRDRDSSKERQHNSSRPSRRH